VAPRTRFYAAAAAAAAAADAAVYKQLDV